MRASLKTSLPIGQARAYYRLAKPGIIYGNILAGAGGYLLAARGQVDTGPFLGMIIGLSLVIGASCVFNNYLDRDIDSKMARTKRRPSVTGLIPLRSGLIYGATLGIIGALILGLFTNASALGLALLGMFSYVIVYGMAKRYTVHGTVIGSISGATPPVVGYCAAVDRLDTGALLLFLIMILWQMPHFYAIAIFRREDYKSAGVPVLSVVKGVARTKMEIVIYIAAYLIAVILLYVFGYAGTAYLLVMTAAAGYWLWKGLKGIKDKADDLWARQMFGLSLIILLIFSALISLNSWLP